MIGKKKTVIGKLIKFTFKKLVIIDKLYKLILKLFIAKIIFFLYSEGPKAEVFEIHLVADNTTITQVSISPTFHEQLFYLKLFCIASLCLRAIQIIRDTLRVGGGGVRNNVTK